MTDLLTENSRLRAALEEIAREMHYPMGIGIPPQPTSAARLARAALATPAPDAVQEAARVLLTDPAAVMALAEAYDREDSAQRGEPDPHGALFENEPCRAEWLDERKHCAAAALRAIAGDRT